MVHWYLPGRFKYDTSRNTSGESYFFMHKLIPDPQTPSRQHQSAWLRLRKLLAENGGAEAVEWIGWMAVVLLLLSGLSLALFTSAPQIADAIVCEVSGWTAKWSGGSGGGCGGGGGSGGTTADGGNSGGGNSGGGNSDGGNSGGGNSGGGELPPPIVMDDADTAPGEPSSPGGGSGGSGGNDRGFLGQIWQGAIVEGLWSDVVGIATLVADGVSVTPIASDVIDFFVPGHSDDVKDKYANLWEYVTENPGDALFALVEEPVTDWQEGRYTEAISNGVYVVASILVPADEFGKLGRIASTTARVDNILPEELLLVLARADTASLDELAEIAQRINQLPDEELARLRQLVDDLTPEQLADLGLTADELRRRGLNDDALRALGLICSFTPNTPVVTAAGLVPIVDIRVGDSVLAYHEGLGETAFYPVEALLAHEDPVIVELTIDGELIKTTPEHPFFVEGMGWLPAGELLPGDSVRSARGTGAVEAIESVAQPQLMYNLTVSEAHTFFVGDGQWLVHNACNVIRYGGGAASELGGQSASIARELANELREKVLFFDNFSVTVGVVPLGNGRFGITAFKPKNPQQWERISNGLKELAEENGYVWIDNAAEAGSDAAHAERVLIDSGYDVIGISNTKGPCPSCQDVIDPALPDVEVVFPERKGRGN